MPSVIAPDGGWHLDWEPAPTWHAALVLIPWWMHLHDGDDRTLRRLWPSIARYLRTELARWPARIASTTLGDWVSPETGPAGGNPEEDPRVSATAFLAAMLATAARIAGAIGEDATPWEAEAEVVARAFRREFYDRASGTVRGRGDRGYRQSHNVIAIALGLLEPHD